MPDYAQIYGLPSLYPTLMPTSVYGGGQSLVSPNPFGYNPPAVHNPSDPAGYSQNVWPYTMFRGTPGTNNSPLPNGYQQVLQWALQGGQNPYGMQPPVSPPVPGVRPPRQNVGGFRPRSGLASLMTDRDRYIDRNRDHWSREVSGPVSSGKTNRSAENFGH